MCTLSLKERENHLYKIEQLIKESQQLLLETCSSLGWDLQQTVKNVSYFDLFKYAVLIRQKLTIDIDLG